MNMSMMNVREMRVLVGDRLVTVKMHMGLLSIPVEVMRMLVMRVVNMGMTVFQGLVRVLVLMPLG